MIKSFLNCALARMPLAYRTVLTVLGRRNNEKFAYLRLVRNGQTVFDVGANTGYYTVLFSHIVGPEGQVHAFEPVPPTFISMTERVAKEQIFRNIRSNQTAVCDLDDQAVEIVLPGNDHGQASLAVHSSGSWSNGDSRTPYLCRSTTLDTYVAVNEIRNIHFIKLDVEGAELLAFRGARNTLRKYGPVILFEFFQDWARDFHYGAAEVIRLLSEAGYGFFYFEDLSVLDNTVERLEKVGRSVNVICSTERLY